MNNIQITQNAIEYLSETFVIEQEEAEEHLITAISMCRFLEDNAGRLKDLERLEVAVREHFEVTGIPISMLRRTEKALLDLLEELSRR
jgi:hypothetical protein